MGLLLTFIVLVIIVAGYRTRKRDDQIGRLRQEWGGSLNRWRDIDAIATYHRWKAEAEPASVIDERTWNDLHLDLVFAEIDRTRSSIGTQLLYHRLRSGAGGETSDRFESLVRHFGESEDTRFRAQRLLCGISHSAGYRLWTLCRDGGVEKYWWYGLFPLLTASVVLTAIAIPIWPRAFFGLLAIVIINIALRVKVATHVFHLLGPFREIGPLLKCAGTILSDPAVSASLLHASRIDQDLHSVESLRISTTWARRNSGLENEVLGI